MHLFHQCLNLITSQQYHISVIIHYTWGGIDNNNSSRIQSIVIYTTSIECNQYILYSNNTENSAISPKY